MADLTYIESTLETKIVGQDATGNNVNYVSADANGNMLVKDFADGPVTPGTVASASNLIGAQFNTSLPTLTNGQQAAIQVDSSGRVIVRNSELPATVDTNYGTVGASTIRTASEIGNATGAANFNTGATGAQTLRVEANQGTANATPWNENLAQVAGTATVTAGVSGLLAVGGNVNSGSADSGNPIKIGGVYNTSLPTEVSGNRVNLQTNVFGELAIVSRNQYHHVAGAATTTVKSGAGRLHTICLNATGNSTTVTVFDNTAGSGAIIAALGTNPGTFMYDIEFTTGLTIVTTNAGTDITVSFQ